jgi:hypothetical protein
MTKEELEKEAVEYAEKINLQNVNISGVVRNHISQAYLAGAKPREKRIEELEKQHDIVRNERNLFQERCEDILENYYCDHKCKCAELEAEVKEWKNKADLWSKTANLKDHNIMINKELEQENAELKKRVDNLYNSDCWASEQLTKAKELLERLLITSCNSDVLNLLPNCSEVLRVRVEAEQFLSEVEK